jgi:hypothetical protein
MFQVVYTPNTDLDRYREVKGSRWRCGWLWKQVTLLAVFSYIDEKGLQNFFCSLQCGNEVRMGGVRALETVSVEMGTMDHETPILQHALIVDIDSTIAFT